MVVSIDVASSCDLVVLVVRMLKREHLESFNA